MMTDHPTLVGADQVHSLLAMISDPATHKARLDELQAQEKATEERIAALNEMADRTRRLNTEAQAQTIVLNNRKTALDARESEIGERAKNLDLTIAARKKSEQEISQFLKQRETAVASREAAVERREAELRDMEAETRDALAKAASLKDKLQKHAAAVQASMSQL